MISPNARLFEQARVVPALFSVVPSGSTPQRVSLKNYERVTAIVIVQNATTVTGSAITLKQAQDVSGTAEKALSFSRALRDIDYGAADTLSEFTVSSDTFTTDSTNSKNLIYVMDVKADELDTENGFDCFRVGTGNATAATVTVIYVLYGAKYAPSGAVPSPIVN
jgi:hypothetical protein